LVYKDKVILRKDIIFSSYYSILYHSSYAAYFQISVAVTTLKEDIFARRNFYEEIFVEFIFAFL